MLGLGRRVLVKINHFEGKHKIVDKWEMEPNIIVEEPHKEIRKEKNNKIVKMLHRNLLLPIGGLPIGSPHRGAILFLLSPPGCTKNRNGCTDSGSPNSNLRQVPQPRQSETTAWLAD